MSKKDLQDLARQFRNEVPFRTIVGNYDHVGGRHYVVRCGYEPGFRHPVSITLVGDHPMKWSDISRKLLSQIEDDMIATMQRYTKSFNEWIDHEFEAEIIEGVSRLVCGESNESFSHVDILQASVDARYDKLNEFLKETYPLPSEFDSFTMTRKVVPPKPDDIQMELGEWESRCIIPFELSESGVSFSNTGRSLSEEAYLKFLALPYIAKFGSRVFSMIHQEGKKP